LIFIFQLPRTVVARTFDYKSVVKSAGISPMDEQNFRQFIAAKARSDFGDGSKIWVLS